MILKFSIAPLSLILLISCASSNDKKMKSAGRAQPIYDSIFGVLPGDSSAFRKATTSLERYYGDPNSPYRDEVLYARVLQIEMDSKFYADVEKKVKHSRLLLLQQNRVGNVANDFTYITPDGKKRRLFEVRAKRILLLFYNPECQACKEMKAALMSSVVVSNAIARGDLKVLAMYIDTDEGLWRRHLEENPGTWLEGRDENEFLFMNNVYDLHAIPTIYLLDKDKKVMLKDCMSVSDIELKLH